MKKHFALAAIAALGVSLSITSCQKTAEKTPEVATEDTAVLKGDGNSLADQTTDAAYAANSEFEGLSYDLPEVKMPNYKGKGLSVRGNDERYAYTLGENVLFKTEQATLSDDGISELKTVANNIEEKFPEGKVHVYGFTDTTGSKAYNKELSEKRAESVKQWMIGNGRISADRISMQAMGEKNPIPGGTNAEDRRVVIVAKK